MNGLNIQAPSVKGSTSSTTLAALPVFRYGLPLIRYSVRQIIKERNFIGRVLIDLREGGNLWQRLIKKHLGLPKDKNKIARTLRRRLKELDSELKSRSHREIDRTNKPPAFTLEGLVKRSKDNWNRLMETPLEQWDIKDIKWQIGANDKLLKDIQRDTTTNPGLRRYVIDLEAQAHSSLRRLWAEVERRMKGKPPDTPL